MVDIIQVIIHNVVSKALICRWVPKLARKYVKPEDICFSDVLQYDPVLLDKAPYRISVTSTVALLGDKVLSFLLCSTVMQASCCANMGFLCALNSYWWIPPDSQCAL